VKAIATLLDTLLEAIVLGDPDKGVGMREIIAGEEIPSYQGTVSVTIVKFPELSLAKRLGAKGTHEISARYPDGQVLDIKWAHDDDTALMAFKRMVKTITRHYGAA